MTSHEGQPAWGRRVLRWAGIALLGLQLAYLVAANAILQTHSLDRWVTGATKGLSLKIGSGWTLWPGRVHVERVELHFEDYNVQFSVRLDSAVVDIALWELPTKAFHLTRVRAEGVRYLFRHRVASPLGLERRLALYPTIPGYSDPPLFHPPHLPPLTDAQYNLWTIQLADVDVGVKELWFLEYRFTGQGRAKGGFRLKPQRDAQTELCSLDLDGVLQAGAQTVASSLRGRIEAQLDRHDPRRVAGAAIFKKISADIDLRAAVPDLQVANLYASKGDPTVHGGAGTMLVRLELSHGTWQTKSALSYATKRVRVAQARFGVGGPLKLNAKIVYAGKDPLWRLSATTPQLTLSFAGSPKGLQGPRARRVRAVLSTTADLAEPMNMAALDAGATLDVPALDWLNVPLDSHGLFASGSAQGSGSVRWSKGKAAQGHIAIDAKDAVIVVAARPIQLTGSVETGFTYNPSDQHGFTRKLAIDLPQVSVAVQHKWTRLSGGVQVPTARLSWRGSPPRDFHGRFALKTSSIKPLVPLVISSGLLRSLALAVIHLGKTQAIVEVNHTEAALELRLAQAQSGSVRAAGVLKKPKNVDDVCGWFFINSPLLNVGLVMQAGSTSVKPFVSNSWGQNRSTAQLDCEPAPS